MLTTYCNSQSVKTKTAYHGVKMQSHIFKHENVPVHTPGTPSAHTYGHGTNMERIPYAAYLNTSARFMCCI